MITNNQIEYGYIPSPRYTLPREEPQIPDSVFADRLKRTTIKMKEEKCDFLFIYADREHFANFEYLTGFAPRFEEAILLLSQDGEATAFLGNECYHLANYSRIPTKGVHYHTLSLPSQDWGDYSLLERTLKELGVGQGSSVGIIGWKLMWPNYATKHTYDIPSFMVEILKGVVGEQHLFNATSWFVHPDYGIRVLNTADEIAFYEFGATHASHAVHNVINKMRSGMTEIEISQNSTSGFMIQTCHPKVVLGERNDIGMVAPTSYVAQLGDRAQITVGLKGGLTSRKGFFAYSEKDLPPGAEDFLEKIAIPYYTAVVNWYQTIGIGVTGGEIYDVVEKVMPASKYHWELNPGHLIATEEWFSSPIAKESPITIKSGMTFQMDIIPQAPKPYAAVNCEDGLAIADEELRKEIQGKYPEAYQRMMDRRIFMDEVLGIKLKDEILPLSPSSGIFRPFMLNHDYGLKVKR